MNRHEIVLDKNAPGLQGIRDGIKSLLEKTYIEIIEEWGGFSYSLYFCWDNVQGQLEEAIDYTCNFDNFERETALRAKDDPDNVKGSELTKELMDILSPICGSQDKTRINIWCDNLDIHINIMDF